MSKEYRVTAPASMAMHRMSASDIEDVIKEHSARMLDTMPEGFRPSGVNRVVLDSAARRIGGGGGGGGDWGGWAEWTRACCGSRALIDDFEDPLIDELEIAGSPVSMRLTGTHVESQMRIVELENPATHQGP
jgi:hypothetical protein